MLTVLELLWEKISCNRAVNSYGDAIVLCKMTLTFAESVDEILVCDRSNES